MGNLFVGFISAVFVFFFSWFFIDPVIEMAVDGIFTETSKLSPTSAAIVENGRTSYDIASTGDTLLSFFELILFGYKFMIALLAFVGVTKIS